MIKSAKKTLHQLQTDCEKAFVKKINSLCNQRQAWQVWADFVTVAAISIANSVDISGEVHDKREKEYKECIKRLDGVDNAWELFNYVVQALDNNQEQDFLGGLYMNLDLGSHWHGQFFTPYDICRMMAKISLNGGERDAKTEILDHGYISINDPACGAGATLIAAANQLRNQYINYQTDALFVGQDIDRIAGMMCYIQLSLLGCAGYVVIANTLSNPITGADVLIPCPKADQEMWYTPMFASDLWTQRRIAKILFHKRGKKAGE